MKGLNDDRAKHKMGPRLVDGRMCQLKMETKNVNQYTLVRMEAPRLHEDPERTTPIGLARYGCDFMEAALAADDKMGAKKGYEIIAPIPVLFLVGQAIELALKSYLLSKGVELRKLKREYGHEIHRSLRKAKEFGLLSIVKLTDEEESAIEVLDKLYSSKQLQYIVTGAKTFPTFGPLESAALKLLHGIGKAVGYEPRDLPVAH